MPTTETGLQRKLSIRDWAKEDRPRERLLAQGPKGLSDVELVAILIRSGTASESALDLARRLLHEAGNDLERLARLSASELMAFKGMGEAKAVSIVAALELGLRRRIADTSERPRVTGSAEAYEQVRAALADLQHEEFWVLFLDRGLRVVDRYRVSQGGLHGTVADPKVIFREALQRRSSCIIVCHNHPSGQLRPSAEDIRLTRKLVEGGALLDIIVQDHLIITGRGYYSFADHGQL